MLAKPRRSGQAACDVDHDGFPDVLVGAYREDPGTSPLDAGRAYTFSGRDGSLLFQLKSPNQQAHGNFGRGASEAGDVNRDGFPDVVVCAKRESTGTSPDEAGRVYVFSGQDGAPLLELKSPNEEEGGGFGGWVSIAGDVDQDAHPDVIVGAWRELRRRTGGEPTEPRFGAGRAYVFSGRDGHLLVQLNSPNQEPFGTRAR
jgi:hypothetical protein